MKSTDDKKNTVKHWIGDRIATEKGEENWVNIRIPNMVFDIHMISGYSIESIKKAINEVVSETKGLSYIKSSSSWTGYTQSRDGERGEKRINKWYIRDGGWNTHIRVDKKEILLKKWDELGWKEKRA